MNKIGSRTEVVLDYTNCRNKQEEQDKHLFKCSVCGGGGSFRTICDFGLFSNKLTVSVCKNCGTVCLNPRWNEKKYEEYYRSHYYGKYQPKILIDKGYNEDDPRGVKIFNDLQDQEYLRSDAKIIEICCGEGENLIVFKKNGFYDLTGLEPSLECCRKLQKFSTISNA